jgi:hypothetical protein
MKLGLCAFAVWLAGASLGIAPAQGTQPFIFHSATVDSGGSPRGIVAADFDGDGHLDFATANLGSAPHDVSVWYGDGHGGFGRPQFLAVGDGPFSIAAGDLNHDGHADLAVAVADSSTMAILLWARSGFVVSAQIGFPPDSTELPNPGNPRGVVIVDVNRDGHADLACTLYEGSSVEFILGAGDGIHWQRSSGWDIGRGAHGLAVADMNNDGRPDLVATNAILGQAYVLYNEGTALASALAETYAVGGSPRNVAIGDFNHDRYPDFAAINTADGTVSIYLQNPAATAAPHFGDPVTISGVGVSPRDIQAVDADGDGVVDLVVSDYGENHLLVLKNDGTGHFPAEGRMRITSASNPRTLAIGDYNEDGRPDVLLGNQTNGAVTLFMNDTPFPGRQ